MYFPTNSTKPTGRYVRVGTVTTHRVTQEEGRRTVLRHLGVHSAPKELPPYDSATQTIKTWIKWTTDGTTTGIKWVADGAFTGIKWIAEDTSAGIKWVADGASSVMSDFTILPMAAAAPNEADAAPAPVSYLVARFDFGKYQTKEERLHEVSNYKELKASIEAAAGKGSVLEFGGSGGYPFLSNLAIKGPNKCMITSNLKALGDPHKARSQQELEALFRQEGIEFVKLSKPVNFAHISFVENFTDTSFEGGLLCMAHAPNDPGDPLRSPDVEKQVRKAFGDPANVIPYELDNLALDKHGKKKCYDGDLVLRPSKNEEGKPVVVVYEQCIVANPTKKGLMSRKDVMKYLRERNVPTIKIPREDHEKVAANFITIDDKPGHVVMPSDISDALKKQFAKHKIVVHYSVDGKLLGSNSGAVDMYGPHCLLLNTHDGKSKSTQKTAVADSGKVDL